MKLFPTSLTAEQSRIVVICWFTYTAFYLGRLNISPALPMIAENLNISLGRVGVLGTAFFVSYAIGQVIMGQIGNIISPRRIILLGLILIATANILFATRTSLLALSALWSLNGFAQAMGWGPMLRILSSKLSTNQIKRTSILFSMTFQIGTAVAWALSGFLIVAGRWQSAFFVPGILLLAIAAFWYQSQIDTKEDYETKSGFKLSDIALDIKQLFPILTTTACIGFVYIGLLIWLPTLIQDWEYLPVGLARLMTAIIPLAGIPGMLLAGLFLSKQADVKQTILSFSLMLLLCLIVSYFSTTLIQVLSVLAIVMLVSGLAGLLLSSAPMLLSDEARVSSIGGLLIAIWSVSGGLSGPIIGSATEITGWSTVILLWIGVVLVAIISIFASSKPNRNQ